MTFVALITRAVSCERCSGVIEGRITHRCGTGAICTGSVCGVCGQTNTTEIHLCGGASVIMNTMDNPVPSKGKNGAAGTFPLNPIGYSEPHDGTTTIPLPLNPIPQPAQFPVSLNLHDPATVTVSILIDVDEEKLDRLLEKLERLASLREELGS